MREMVRSNTLPKPRGVYSPGVVAGEFLFISGQGPVNPESNEIELGEIRSETRRTLRNIQAILEAAGSSLDDVVKLGVFLADLKDFEAMNEVFREFFPEDPPARTTVGAQLPKIKIEIDAVAHLRSNGKKG